jgi:hypothetical protein
VSAHDPSDAERAPADRSPLAPLCPPPGSEAPRGGPVPVPSFPYDPSAFGPGGPPSTRPSHQVQNPPYAGFPPGYGGFPVPVDPQAGTTNGLAIASLICGILGLFVVTAILAVVFGHVAVNQVRARGQVGDGMAKAGFILGYVWLGLLVLGAMANASHPHSRTYY